MVIKFYEYYRDIEYDYEIESLPKDMSSSYHGHACSAWRPIIENSMWVADRN